MVEQEHDGSEFIYHQPCAACGSSDANGVYTDGHTHCFSCGHHTKATGEPAEILQRHRKPADLISGECMPLKKRGISQETCEHFGYQIGEYKGRTVQIAPYYDSDNNLVAQKIRYKDKTFRWLGDQSEALPFGAQAFPKSGKKIVVTEGEIDALSMSQVQGNKWPVVSISCGAGPQVRKYMAQQKEYFSAFDEVILMFDMDEKGRQAAKEAAKVLGARAKIADLPVPFKDANEMLIEERVEDLVNAMWRAQPYRPEGLVDLSSQREKVKEAPVYGLSLPFPTLNKITFGLRLGEIWAFGAGTGVGKSTLLLQIAHHLIAVHKVNVGAFFLEQSVRETSRRVAGVEAEKTFHVPDSGWTDADIDAAFDRLDPAKGTGKLFLYDSFGNNTWDTIKEKIEYLHHTEGVNYFFLDHLTALATWQDDERQALDLIMSEMSTLTQRLNITILLISHLSTPDGKPHEEGGRVMIRHFRGSRSIGYWSHGMFGLERDQQADDPTQRSLTTLRVLKDRFTGQATGETITLKYGRETGLLYEGDDAPAGEYGLKDEATEGSDF